MGRITEVSDKEGLFYGLAVGLAVGLTLIYRKWVNFAQVLGMQGVFSQAREILPLLRR